MCEMKVEEVDIGKPRRNFRAMKIVFQKSQMEKSRNKNHNKKNKNLFDRLIN